MKDLKLTLKELQEMYKNADATTKQYLENKFKVPIWKQKENTTTVAFPDVAHNRNSEDITKGITEGITTIIGGYTDACKYLNRQELELENFKFLPKSQWVNAFCRHKILTVVEALVSEFVPDYSNYSRYKYGVYSYHDDENGLHLAGYDYFSCCYGGSDFVFPTAELRGHAMKIMETEYLQILTVKGS